MEWQHLISLSRNTLQEELNKPDLLPVTEDLEVLWKHPVHKIVTCTETLEAPPPIQNWGELAEIILCQVITFHNQEGAEVSKMLLCSFVEWPKSATKGIEDCL